MTPNLVLIDMHGAGKNTIGHLLAQELNRTCIDTDRLIEIRMGLSVTPSCNCGRRSSRPLRSA